MSNGVSSGCIILGFRFILICLIDEFVRSMAGLRALQGRKELDALVKQVKITRDRMPWGSKASLNG